MAASSANLITSACSVTRPSVDTFLHWHPPQWKFEPKSRVIASNSSGSLLRSTQATFKSLQHRCTAPHATPGGYAVMLSLSNAIPCSHLPSLPHFETLVPYFLTTSATFAANESASTRLCASAYTLTASSVPLARANALPDITI
jgi:hypothetical protein